MDAAAIKKELLKCSRDPVHFINKYIKVVHPVRGLVPFALYPFQKRIVNEFVNNRFNILRKFRQAGCTTLSAAYALWMITFQPHKTVVFLSKGDTESTEILDRVKIMYEELPVAFRRVITSTNMHVLKFDNGSQIKSRPSGRESGRSLSGSLLIVDEAAFIEHIETIWAAVYPILSTGGRAIILSTVNGVGNWYHDTYLDTIGEKNSFKNIEIVWQEHPEYHRTPGYEDTYAQMMRLVPPVNVDDWERVTRSNISHKKWLQEYEREFLGTGDTFLDGSILQNLSELVAEPNYKRYNNRMWLWKDPEPGKIYVLGADTSLGRDLDYSAFVILDAYTGEQVAEFYSNRTPINEFADIIATESWTYNEALVVPERNTIGTNLIDHLFNRLEYENIWFDERSDPGLQVTVKNRENLLARLEQAIRMNEISLSSPRLVNELTTFIFTPTGRIEAEKTKNDDLIMSLAMAVYGWMDMIADSPEDFSLKYPVREENADYLAPSKRRVSSHGGMVKEDIKWLMS